MVISSFLNPNHINQPGWYVTLLHGETIAFLAAATLWSFNSLLWKITIKKYKKNTKSM